MTCVVIFIIYLLVSIIKISDARIYYTVGPNGNVQPQIYYPLDENDIQASRDLDMTFSTGNPSEYNNIIYPFKKDFTPQIRPGINIIRENNRPVYVYKWPTEVPTRRRIYDGDSSIVSEEKKNFDLVKFNEGKGEVVLELRVIANNNAL